MQVPQTKQRLESLGPEIQICLLNIRTSALQLCALMGANPGYGGVGMRQEWVVGDMVPMVRRQQMTEAPHTGASTADTHACVTIPF